MQNDKYIRITCDAADLLDIDELTPFQGQFKKRNKKDIQTLSDAIITYGFSCPFFVWKNDNTNYILDGHGRHLALKYLQDKGYLIPALPVVYIEAEDIKQAKLKVLELNNINGSISKEVLLEFAELTKIDVRDLHIPGILFGPEDIIDTALPQAVSLPESENERIIKCPHCDADVRIRID